MDPELSPRAEIQEGVYFASRCVQIVEVADDRSVCALHGMCMCSIPACGAGEEGEGTSLGLGLGNVVEGCWFGSSVWGAGMEQELLDEFTLVCKARGHTCCPSSGRCSQSCLSFCHVQLSLGPPSPGLWLQCSFAVSDQDLKSQTALHKYNPHVPQKAKFSFYILC